MWLMWKPQINFHHTLCLSQLCFGHFVNLMRLDKISVRVMTYLPKGPKRCISTVKTDETARYKKTTSYSKRCMLNASMISERKRLMTLVWSCSQFSQPKARSHASPERTSTLTDQKTEAPACCSAIQNNSMYFTTVLIVCVEPFCGLILCKYLNWIAYFPYILGRKQNLDYIKY